MGIIYQRFFQKSNNELILILDEFKNIIFLGNDYDFI